jgi:hypothetical protein
MNVLQSRKKKTQVHMHTLNDDTPLPAASKTIAVLPFSRPLRLKSTEQQTGAYDEGDDSHKAIALA